MREGENVSRRTARRKLIERRFFSDIRRVSAKVGRGLFHRPFVRTGDFHLDPFGISIIGYLNLNILIALNLFDRRATSANHSRHIVSSNEIIARSLAEIRRRPSTRKTKPMKTNEFLLFDVFVTSIDASLIPRPNFLPVPLASLVRHVERESQWSVRFDDEKSCS